MKENKKIRKRVPRAAIEAPLQNILDLWYRKENWQWTWLKLKGILEWPTPKTVKEVRSFLGFVNFYRQFIKNFSHLAHPLNDLLKRDKKFIWSNKCQESFDLLKKCYRRTSAYDARPSKAIPDTSQFITVCYQRNSYPNGYKWRLSPLCISVQKSDRRTNEL